MSKSPRKRARTVEVQIMFEPNRLQHHLLHKAYSCLVPVLKRRLMTNPPEIEGCTQAQAAAKERNFL